MGSVLHRAFVPLALVLVLPLAAQEEENLFLKRRSLPARMGPHAIMMQRSAIETSTAPAIAQALVQAFDAYCAKQSA